MTAHQAAAPAAKTGSKQPHELPMQFCKEKLRMPELPEVETVRRGLERWVVGKKFSQVRALHPRVWDFHDFDVGLGNLKMRVIGKHRCRRIV